jgi:hypothetical protein
VVLVSHDQFGLGRERNSPKAELDARRRAIQVFEVSAPEVTMHFECGADDGKRLRIPGVHLRASTPMDDARRMPRTERREMACLTRKRSSAIEIHSPHRARARLQKMPTRLVL